MHTTFQLTDSQQAALERLGFSYLPVMAGAAEDDPAPGPKPDDPKPDDPKPEDKPEDKDELGEGGKAALEAERRQRRTAEKAARDAQKKLDELEREKLSETERLQRDAEAGREALAKANDTLRRANLLTALAESGLTGAKAKAAMRLIDNVEYDDDNEPTNLPDALTVAKAAYGEEMFTASATPAPPKPGDKPQDRLDLHQGPRPPADGDEEAKMAAYMKANFPQLEAPEGAAA